MCDKELSTTMIRHCSGGFVNVKRIKAVRVALRLAELSLYIFHRLHYKYAIRQSDLAVIFRRNARLGCYLSFYTLHAVLTHAHITATHCTI